MHFPKFALKLRPRDEELTEDSKTSKSIVHFLKSKLGKLKIKNTS